MSVFRSALLAVLTLALVACASPAYHAQAISGHLALMNSREPLPEVLARLPADDPTAQRLRLAQSILGFAEQSLALPAGDSYQSFVATDGGAVTWNVIATPRFALEPERWCFAVAGCVPYRGYFDEADAQRFADRLRRKGLDVAVSRATAYSTLGWFDDPILGTMLDGSEADLAAVLFHELAHLAVYIPGDTAFNESYASFVEREGVRSWMQARGEMEGLARWQERQAVSEAFLQLLRATRDDLATLYAQPGDEDQRAADKAQVFAQLEDRYAKLVAERWEGRNWYRGWFDPPPNNADLALLGSYTGGLCAFDSLWAEAGRDFERFHALARRQGELERKTRRDWLRTPCTDSTDTAHVQGEVD